ncbi:MAG: hypothetical protein CME31_22490 [Gimesia sp.]|uniref:DUF3732 domain-containing protein n=1 Tax=Gimesia maris TaxID=122 RepID=A0A3D3RE09_9PLAN|nr:hypothetical protein [Gimesia sp.]HCO27053.1 hypothetical protein [Gimesia maris]|tara:strand:- start:325 stop:2271 length:1947 start_codon:yes stop_codon:yes gene_type:complete
MSRMQIASIYLYSHHDQRLDLDFELSAVNILVGVSYSGKSSLIEVIDYCLGASECHIPGVVREATSWVGVLWRNGKSDILLCRRVPPPAGLSSEEVYFSVGAPVEVPAFASTITANTNRDGGLRQFEQALKMGVVAGETFTEREGTRISFRNAIPYLLQSDEVIINKSTLLRGANDERRLSISDSLPYFLGAVDEATARAETKLRQIRTQRDRESRRIESADKTLVGERDRALGLLAEAAQLQMVDRVSDNAPQDIITTLLQRVSGWATSPETFGEQDQLQSLYATERDLRQQYAIARHQLDAANMVIESAVGYSDAVERQRSRLDVIGYFKSNVERDACPVCNGSIREKTPSLSNIESALGRLQAELSDVERDRPKIDDYAKGRSEDLIRIGQELETVRTRIAAVIRESEEASERMGLDERRLRVSGRVSYYLDDRTSAIETIDRSRIERLEAEIRELEQIADPEAKAERIEVLQTQVSIHATELLKRLPFDPNYRSSQIAFNARKLSIRFVFGPRVMQMLDIGGDESYLSGHVATLLALHRVFSDGQRPVPGVVVFDQLSRPFFPADVYQGEVEVRGDGDDRDDLKRYFDVIFDEVEQQKSLQVIVLEHAFFADDPRYVKAVKKRWTLENRLIPPDWPRVLTSPDE